MAYVIAVARRSGVARMNIIIDHPRLVMGDSSVVKHSSAAGQVMPVDTQRGQLQALRSSVLW